jgi:hypothetical protein
VDRLEAPNDGGNKMQRKTALGMALAVAAAMVLVPAAMAADKVTGDVELAWNECFTGPGDEVPDWVGTVDIDGDVHDMVFFNLGDGRPPNQDPAEGTGAFIEIWAIYDGLELAYDDACAPQTFEGDMVMWGHDAGLSDREAQQYAMTGTVVEAFGDYADLAGQPIYMSGNFTLTDDGEPLTAPGVIEFG